MTSPQTEAPPTWRSAVSLDARRRVVAAYQSALPENEWAAVRAWLHTFYPFQLEWLLDPARFAVCNKSRQIGMSHTTAALVVLWAAMLGETTTLISIGQREANEVRAKAEKHARALVAMGSKWARAKTHGDELRFASGGRIIAVPSSSGGRSFSGNVFLDEFAYLDRPAEIWDAAAAVTLHAGKFRVGSTPNGVGNDFHMFWSRPEKNRGWSKHEFPIERAIADGMRVDIDDCWKMAKGDPRLFDQFFRCSFLDGEQQYIPSHLIKQCEVESTFCYEGHDYAGLDIGRSHDISSLYVVRKDNAGVRWVQGFERRRRTSGIELDELVAIAFGKQYRVQKLTIDATGMGTFPAENYQRIYGAHYVEAFTFTNPSKEALATGLYQAFADKTIRIHQDDEALQLDIASIRRIVTDAGNIRYDAPHTEDGHADNAWALAMAIHACSSPPNYRTEVRG